MSLRIIHLDTISVDRDQSIEVDRSAYTSSRKITVGAILDEAESYSDLVMDAAFAAEYSAVKQLNANYTFKSFIVPGETVSGAIANDVITVKAAGTVLGVTRAIGDRLKFNGTGWDLLAEKSNYQMQSDLATEVVNRNTAVSAEATNRQNADEATRGAGWSSAYSNMGLVGLMSVPPEYTAPTYSTLNLSPSLAEVGENVYPVLSMASFVQNDGGAPDKEAAVVKVDGVTQVKDTNYEINGDTITFLTPLQRTGLDDFNITVSIPYAQGPIKNDEVLGTPNDTGRIEAGSVTASANLYYEYGMQAGSDGVVFPEAASVRGLGATLFGNTRNVTWTQGDLALMIVIRDSETLDSVTDITDLPVPLTPVLQADNTTVDANNTAYGCKYYAITADVEFDNDRTIQIKKH